jgi:hypothetical protein
MRGNPTEDNTAFRKMGSNTGNNQGDFPSVKGQE